MSGTTRDPAPVKKYPSVGWLLSYVPAPCGAPLICSSAIVSLPVKFGSSYPPVHTLHFATPAHRNRNSVPDGFVTCNEPVPVLVK